MHGWMVVTYLLCLDLPVRTYYVRTDKMVPGT
jgi:hypothetical protein